MKLIIFCAVVALVVVGTTAQEYTLGLMVADESETASTTCTQSGPQCSSDCSTLMICAANIPTPLQTVTCSSPTQYCVGGACSATPGANCTTGPSFLCTEDAIFPEPSDCSKYRVCNASVSTLYQCPTGFIYNTKVNLCQKGTLPCTKIDCSKYKNKYVAYSSNTAYYAYCLDFNNGTIQTIMFKCPFEQYNIFDTTTNSCRFNCKAKGNFQDPANCQQYFYCSAAGAKPTTPILCPGNYVFDGTGCNPNADKCQYPPPAPATGTV